MDFYHSSRYQVNVLSWLNTLLLAVHYNIEFLGVTLYSAVWCARHPFFYSLIYQGELSLSNTLYRFRLNAPWPAKKSVLNL